MAKEPKKPAAKKPAALKAKPAKLLFRADDGDEPLPELEKMLQTIPTMSTARKGRLRQRIHDRIVNHAVKLGLTQQDATAKLGDGTLMQWLIDNGPKLAAAAVAFLKMLLSIFTALGGGVVAKP